MRIQSIIPLELNSNIIISFVQKKVPFGIEDTVSYLAQKIENGAFNPRLKAPLLCTHLIYKISKKMSIIFILNFEEFV